jgi:tetratricopeptide (TPR) repeat protein
MATHEQSYLSYFTPSQMSHEMLEAILVKRQSLAARLVDRVRQSVLTETKHQNLLLGPRGMGKSYLVALIYHRVKNLTELEGKIVLAPFAEEEWSITSLTDLFLVILKALEREYGGLQAQIDALYRLPIRDIEHAASTLIREFVGERTLFLMMENLSDIFRGLGSEGQWAFRAFLNERPFVTILATTPSLFDGVEDRESAFYGFFHHIYLDELNVEEATELLEKVAARRNDPDLTEFLKTPTARERVQAVHDLAGGHPRIYLLFAHLLTQETLDELVTPFMKLLDELTPYYQSRMQLLSPQQRKIIEFLCTARGAVAVKEIAAQNLMTPQTASSQLDKLEEMAYVRKTPVGRESWYELREPLLRLVIEIKRGRGEPVRLIVDFLRRWYSRRERQERLALAPPNRPLTREYLIAALDLEQAIQDRPDLERAAKLVEEYDQCMEVEDYKRASDIAAEIIERKGKFCNANDWQSYAYSLAMEGQYILSLKIWHKALSYAPQNEILWNNLGVCSYYLGDYTNAFSSFDKALDIDPMYDYPTFNRAILHLAMDQWDEFVKDITNGFILPMSSSKHAGDTKEYCHLLLEQDDIGEKIETLAAIYSKNGLLKLLGEGLTKSISKVLANRISLSQANKWLVAWQSTAIKSTELEIPVRILAAAVEWKKTQDIRALLALPIEERRILERMLPKEEEAKAVS